MPCYFPLQATYSDRDDGKKDVRFSKFDWFVQGVFRPNNCILIPCGKCMGCRLERSRQWAVRCVHESKCYDCNCFVTLTYNEDNLPSDGSLRKQDVQLFIKRLRKRYSDRKIRVFYCGEYGENLLRPHYHICLFNIDFKDKVHWKTVNGNKYYVSDELSDLWKFGFCTIGDLTFESAAYVARYCTKKVTGSLAHDHYKGRAPEFVGMSLKPGIGKPWLDKFGKSDVFPHDTCISRGVKCKLPRYYDVLWERERPLEFARVKEARCVRGKLKEDDNTFRRLAVKLKCLESRIKLLVRTMEK